MTPASTRASAPERDLLAAARAGDESAFRMLVQPHHSQLHAHCYRMLGSLHDADDALQDALLRAWRGLRGLERRSSLRSWLYRIATNACLDLIARRPKRVLPIDYGPPAGSPDDFGDPLPASTWIEPYPDSEIGIAPGYAAPEARYEQRESVELAFIAALQHLVPRQRAALILFEVLGFSAREIAQMLDTTIAAVNSAIQRARAVLDKRLPEQSQQPNRGRAAIDAFLPVAPGLWRLVPTRANAQLAFGAYRWDEEAGSYRPRVLDVLALREERIASVTAFATPDVFRRFALPDELDRRDTREQTGRGRTLSSVGVGRQPSVEQPTLE
jgi:RNA polymerase sigma-70 factor (ECF subfamily)